MTAAALTSLVSTLSFRLQGFSGWFAGTPSISFIHRSVDFFTERGPQNFALDVPCTMIVAQMTKKEAIRRLENLALETGHKRNYYVKRALVEFLDRNEHFLGRTHTNGFRDPPRSVLPPEQVSSLIRAA